MDKYLRAAMHAVIEMEADGAVRMEQTLTSALDGQGRCVTTAWYDKDGKLIRQDQAILVDKLPIIGGLAEL